ncbi:carbonic anhydrase [Trichonephila clavipes]|nr:carbonic anhydrase [Trichonephila clavipes]
MVRDERYIRRAREYENRQDLREPFEAPSAREKTIVSPRSTAGSELWRLDFRELSEAPIVIKRLSPRIKTDSEPEKLYLSDKDNPALEPIIDKLDDIRTEGSKVDMDDFTLESLLPDDLMPYYRYEGSLTTPPCSEIVTWTIFKDFVPISEKQLQQFRNVKEEDEGEAPESLVDNFRMPQPLHGRVIEVSGEGNSAGIIGPSVVMVLSALSFLL